MVKIQLKGKSLKTFETMGQRVSVTPAEVITMRKSLTLKLFQVENTLKLDYPALEVKQWYPTAKSHQAFLYPFTNI
jgi:hypothetical protein